MPGRTPDYRYVVKTVTTPAGTPSSAPLKTSVTLGDVTLLDVQIVIPDGHAGQTGIAVVSDNFGIVPWDPAVSYVVGNNEEPVFGVDMTMGHPIAIWTYNTGAFDHRHHVRFRVRESVLDVAPAAVGPITIKTIPDASTADVPADTTVVGTESTDDGSEGSDGATGAVVGSSA